MDLSWNGPVFIEKFEAKVELLTLVTVVLRQQYGGQDGAGFLCVLLMNY